MRTGYRYAAQMAGLALSLGRANSKERAMRRSFASAKAGAMS
jgi:hypothetical protein